MKMWNLLTFDELSPVVLSSVDKDSSLQLPSVRQRVADFRASSGIGFRGTAVLVAALALTSLNVNAVGSDSKLRLLCAPTTSNIQTDKPPLTLLFGARHALKWHSEKEAEMLARAAESVASASSDRNEANMIQAVLREELPSGLEHAVDLKGLGVKRS